MDAINGRELCQNLTFLGRSGLYATANGLLIAYLSGTEAPSDGRSSSHELVYFSQSDVDRLVASLPTEGVDILLTTQWPAGIYKHTASSEDSVSIYIYFYVFLFIYFEL